MSGQAAGETAVSSARECMGGRDRERPSACTGVPGGSDAAASAAVDGASDDSRAAASASTSSRAPSTRRS